MQATAVAAAADPAPAAIQQDQFVKVPDTILPNGTLVPAFEVGQYLCSKGPKGIAIVSADGAPWVSIKYHNARKACEAAGFALITELQALAIAYQVALLAANWSGDAIEGHLFQGLHKGTVRRPQPGSYESADQEERRWFVLTNGERIYDVAGNAYSWVFDDVQGDEQGLVAKPFAKDSPSITTPTYASLEKGVGWYPKAGANGSGYALIRGGCWYSGSDAGVFALSSVGPGYADDYVGFRCTKPGR